MSTSVDLRPDPRSDLDWSGFVGAIHDIFADNAERFPERICVVETGTREPKTQDRIFTYKAINEASNILAHHLQGAGITNGDIVMIWAHRSVDLVVAIMGTLKAGATFSVLDPLYPPERQKIYLEVAQPRALVNLARATDEAGELSHLVRSYIDSELKLKTEVPSLRIGDDGVLSGGQIDGKDVFAAVRAQASTRPDTLVGPDSNPTLSFTSGSEGRPKGVLGRHYSLAYYFDWMASEFGLSKDSKFTMLSGIAHDPIQRDIFTPLFLGAQLLVPSKEDIQHEKLSEWMAEYSPTVTTLTPAMGQILVGGASAEFPALRSAFFVGDILTKRDCELLRRLAKNVTVVNMYGTTETQRSVSFYKIPSRASNPDFFNSFKDVVPAGQGMKNVQLLVVDQKDSQRICNVGETGEIYVRAAGMAEGYMGDKAMNEKKFLKNWFTDANALIEADKKQDKGEKWRKYWQGPRDRLYRTGDLGRYLEDGNVECTGRADDQVKIRGFRIELGDINSNLGQHYLIRDCITLVRRDKNEEPTLVSYIVPEMTKWVQWLEQKQLKDEVDDETDESMGAMLKRFRPLQEEVRNHLKGKLPTYAVPTHFIPMKKLPLNPNGKVDKPRLPFPDVVDFEAAASTEDLQRWSSLSETQQKVATKWGDLIHGLNAKAIKPEDDFFNLGGHSILAQQMLLDIKREVGANVQIGALYENPTLSGFSAHIDHLLDPSKTTNGTTTNGSTANEYARSLDKLIEELPKSYQTADPATMRASSRPTVFLTGATGFLGAYLIKDVLDRTSRQVRVIAHVRNVKDPKAALDRLRRSCEGYGLWDNSWQTRLSCVVGDLASPQLGIDDQTWNRLSDEVDVVIHNGAAVHWVRRYQDMMASNVLSTVEAMRLCNTGKPKIFTFVSSTSALDTDHYVNLSEQAIRTGEGAILESDDMEGSRSGLGTGYGQTKWVSEQLIREAGRRGLTGSVIRPGYILGDSETGTCNTDDFLIRLLKGCIQLSSRPKIVNSVNSVPVNHVSRVVVAAALNPIPNGVHVVHVTGHPRLRMNEYLSLLEYYGYKVPEVPYDSWKQDLERFVSAGGRERDASQHALMPLYHFVINDLPATTRAPELDDANAVKILKADAEHWTGMDESAGAGISREDVGRYLRYLAETKFIGWPNGRGRALPEVTLSQAQKEATGAVGGRGGAGK